MPVAKLDSAMMRLACLLCIALLLVSVSAVTPAPGCNVEALSTDGRAVTCSEENGGLECVVQVTSLRMKDRIVTRNCLFENDPMIQ